MPSSVQYFYSKVQLTLLQYHKYIQRCHTEFWWRSLRGAEHLEDPGGGGRSTLQCYFWKWDGKARTGLIWLRTWSGGGRSWMWLWTFVFHKMWLISLRFSSRTLHHVVIHSAIEKCSKQIQTFMKQWRRSKLVCRTNHHTTHGTYNIKKRSKFLSV